MNQERCQLFLFSEAYACGKDWNSKRYQIVATEARCIYITQTSPKVIPEESLWLNNILDVFECDLLDVQALSNYNDNYKYLLTVIVVFSKF